MGLGAFVKSTVLLAVISGLLVGCKSSEERAAEAFEQAILLMDDGDLARAGVAFNNVFKYDPSNTEAREIYAEFLRRSGDPSQAAGQYLRLLEQRPDYLPGLISMTELAMESYRWDVAQTHLTRAQQLASAQPKILALGAVMDYVLAVGTGNTSTENAAMKQMMEAVQDMQLLPLSRALADGWLRRNDPAAALATIDSALQVWAEDRPLHDQRLIALHALGRSEAVAAQFRSMIDLFPQSRDIAARYVEWLARGDQVDMAEEFLRQRAEVASGEVARTLELIKFLATWKGPDAVLGDLDALVDSDADPLLFRAMRATVIFQTGAQNDAIADLRDIVAEATASSVEATRSNASRYRIVLAQMLDRTGDRAGAEAMIAPVISERPNLADAALLQARFLLEKGQNTDAITTLRAALGADESDPQLLLLLARAHAAKGADALATRTLSLAFGASGHSPEIALAFAAHLAEDGRVNSAIDVLNRALSSRPLHPGLLAASGALYVERADWNRAAQVSQTMRDLNAGAVSDRAADQLDLAILAARAPVDDTLASIESQDASERAGTMAYLALIQTYMASDRSDDARRVLDQGLENAPENPLLLAVSARLSVSQGQADQAVKIYRTLLAQDPKVEYFWISLAQAVATNSDTDAVLAVLDEGLAAHEDSLRLFWERALLLHQAGRTDEAISAYEAMLLRAPEQLPVVNNLASLLSTARQDDASLARAGDLALLLDPSDIPQFRSTLGWIRFRQGDVNTAVNLLVPAAEALTDDPLAQIQAAEALIAAQQIAPARGFLARALALVAPETEIASRAQEMLADITALGFPNEG